MTRRDAAGLTGGIPVWWGGQHWTEVKADAAAFEQV